MKDFRDLKVWEKGHQLTLAIHRVSARFPKEERYGLTSQIRRSSASIPPNIAEGSGRGGDAEFARFIQIAIGSASETEYHLILAKDLKLLGEADYEKLSGEIMQLKKMLISLVKKLRARAVHE